MAHPEEARMTRIAFDLDRHGADALFERERLRSGGHPAEMRERPRGTDRRMTGERKLVKRSEDAHTRNALRSRRRQEERRLGEIHLASDRLHFGVVESGSVEKDGERVAAEDPVGEDVDLNESILATHDVAPERRASALVSPSRAASRSLAGSRPKPRRNTRASSPNHVPLATRTPSRAISS